MWDKIAAGREDIGILAAQKELIKGLLGGKWSPFSSEHHKQNPQSTLW
jgi:hypothetical protein